MNAPIPFSVRVFLRQREALLVHFNTPMATKHPTGFPDDLILTRTLPGPLCFSTIQVGDRGPWQGGPPVNANAGGSVGIVVDVDEQSVIRVDHTDSGFIDGVGSAGRSPTAVTCAASIDRRTTSNEWLVTDFKPLGIFVFLPAEAFVRGQEVSVSLADVLEAFPDDRIFSVFNGLFVEFDRGSGAWGAITYDQIVPT